MTKDINTESRSCNQGCACASRDETCTCGMDCGCGATCECASGESCAPDCQCAN